MNINVNPNGSVDFKTITEAIDNIPAPNTRRVVVFIAPGLYRTWHPLALEPTMIKPLLFAPLETKVHNTIVAYMDFKTRYMITKASTTL
ncbi:pectinesterase [Trifolium repens]|nr:pectinesterase [Trifolium repens]